MWEPSALSVYVITAREPLSDRSLERACPVTVYDKRDLTATTIEVIEEGVDLLTGLLNSLATDITGHVWGLRGEVFPRGRAGLRRVADTALLRL